MLTFRASAPDTPEARRIIDAYFALRAAEFPGAYRPSYPDPALFVPPRGVFLLAELDGAVVGCGGIRRIDDSDAGIRYEVKHLFLKPETRGQGGGRALLEELERQAQEWDAAELVLDTHHTLEAAGHLYARTGFESIAPYNDNPNATRWYRKTL